MTSQVYRHAAHDLLRSLTDDQIAWLSLSLDEVPRRCFADFCQNVAEDDVTQRPHDCAALVASALALVAFKAELDGDDLMRRRFRHLLDFRQEAWFDAAVAEVVSLSRALN